MNLIILVFLVFISRGSCDDYCAYPLINSGYYVKLSATSTLHGRGPENALIDSKTNNYAWTPTTSDYNQFLTVELKKPLKISGIGTLGLGSSWVKEYSIRVSRDGDNWRGLQSAFAQGGGDYYAKELFKGNKDGDSLHVNTFQTPIIARFVRINPTRWHDRISMRVELYGCDYVSQVLHFNGSSLIYRNLTNYPIQSRKDTIKFRFKTSQPDGILIYSKGTQSDFFALQLVDNRMVLNINLGSPSMTTITAGSLLDDNLWHDTIISRYLNTLSFTVDRVEVTEKIKGDYLQLDLNKVLYIGGVPHTETGLVTGKNFTGCIENLYLNDTNVIYKLKNPDYYEGSETFYKNNTFYNCPESNVVPVSFLPHQGGRSFVKLKGYEGVGVLNVSFEFRTFQEGGVVFYHKFTGPGGVKLYMDKSKLLIELQTESTPRLLLDNFATDNFNDGLWHRVIFSISNNLITLSVDERMVRTTRIIRIITGFSYFFGGTPETPETETSTSPLLTPYTGCLRLISIDGNFQNPLDWKDSPTSILLDSCQMLDRCSPNPCEHGSKCKQNSQEFTCDCEDTGYTGATCHMPLYPLSCASYQLTSFKSQQTIDIDGSGELKPFPVTCQIVNGEVETILHHASEESVLVDGYDGAGSFAQRILYDGEGGQVEGLLNRSRECGQFIKFECRGVRLFGDSGGRGVVGQGGQLMQDDFRPFSWWVSRQNTPMDYWGGSLLGSRKCECGILGQCEMPEKSCNCDSGLDTWLSDEGYLTDMTYLPVRMIRIGDTGTVSDQKLAKFTLGPLVCRGDALHDNEITFRLPDATLQFPLPELSHSWDIYFEFKTTTRNAVILHSKGQSDYIKIEIINGNLIKFQVEAGSGPLGVNIQTTGKLNDNQWHSVHVEKNRKQCRIVLDGSQSSTVLQPSGQVRAIELQNAPLYVGSGSDSRDGYVGCLRSLLVNGQMLDLKTAVENYKYGVGVGCSGKCDSGPCQNNGTCEEGYDHYDCDCRFTSFKGPICADEIGINLQSNSFIKYDFYGSYKSTIAERLRVGFTTTEPKGFLVGIFSNKTGEYLTLSVSNSGHLRLVFDFGFERQEIIFPEQNFATGQYHDVEIRRSDGGTKLTIKVDNFAPKSYLFDVKASADAQFNNIEYLYIGKNESMREGFIGCVSRVEFDDIFPLKYYFQEDRPKYIRSYPDSLLEDFCGVEPMTHPPDVIESRPVPQLHEEKLRKLYKSSTQSAILGGLLALIFLLIVIFAVLIGRYLSQHKGQYLTQEDDGAVGVQDANDAVTAGVTGHSVGKKKEWFI